MSERLRRLHLDGRLFVWKAEIRQVAGIGDHHRCLRFRAWGAGKNSQPLEADLLSTEWSTEFGMTGGDGSYPTTADARALITYALANGWQPASRHGTFRLTERDFASRFSLTGFLLTDRLRTPDEGDDPTLRVLEHHAD